MTELYQTISFWHKLVTESIYLNLLVVQFLQLISLYLFPVLNAVILSHCGHCCLLLQAALCNDVSILWGQENTSLFPHRQNCTATTDDSSKGKACILGTSSVAIENSLTCQRTFSITHTENYASSVAHCLDHMQTINIYCNYQTYVRKVMFFLRSAARVDSVLLELFGVLQQVFICQLSELLLPGLIENIPWNFLMLP